MFYFFRDKSDDEQNPAQSAEMMDNVVFQPVQMSNEELEDMLENLENENPMLEEQAIACSHDAALSESEGKTSENLGARPKEFPIPHSENFAYTLHRNDPKDFKDLFVNLQTFL